MGPGEEGWGEEDREAIVCVYVCVCVCVCGGGGGGGGGEDQSCGSEFMIVYLSECAYILELTQLSSKPPRLLLAVYTLFILQATKAGHGGLEAILEYVFP